MGLWWWQIRNEGEPIYHDDIINYQAFKTLIDKVRARKTKLEQTYAANKAGTRNR